MVRTIIVVILLLHFVGFCSPLLRVAESPDIIVSSVLVTANGKLHAITDDKLAWSVSTGGPLLSSGHIQSDRDYNILPSTDGTLHIHHFKRGIFKTPLKVRELAGRCLHLCCVCFGESY